MKYDPRDSVRSIPAGTYDAAILAVSTVDKDGAPLKSKKTGEAMELVVFEVFTPEGTRQHRQYYTSGPSGTWFYRSLAHALDRAQEFSDSLFDASNYIGSTLRLELEVQEGGQYDGRNTLKAHHRSENRSVVKEPSKTTASPKKAPVGHVPISEEDIPF